MSQGTPEKDERWAKLGRQLNGRAKSMWPKRYTTPGNFSLILHQLRTMELYKDMGYVNWRSYRYAEWGPRAASINAWYLVGMLLVTVPDALRLAPPGAVNIRALAAFAPLCETSQDVLWWGRLARVTTFNELTRTVEAFKQARRCAIPGTSSYLVAAFIYGHHYTGVVSEALRQARRELGEDTQLGGAIAWACARAVGRPLPRPLGVDPRDVRPLGRKAGDPPHLVGGPVGGDR